MNLLLRRFSAFFIILVIFSPLSGIFADGIDSAVNGKIYLTDIDNTGKIIPLTGTWSFYWKKFIVFTPQDQPDEYLKVPGNWNMSDKFPPSGYGTYLLKLNGLKSGSIYAIYAQDAGTAFNVFIDGKLYFSNGHPGTNRYSTEPAAIPGIIIFKAHSESETLAVQVSNFHYRKAGLWKNFYIGRPSQILSNYQKKLILDAVLAGLLFFVSIYHLMLFSVRREEKTALYFGLLIFVILTRILVTQEELLTYLIPSFPWEAARRIEFFIFSGGTGFSLLYFYYLYPKDFNKKVLSILLIPSAVFFIIFTFFPVRISNNFVPYGELYIIISIFSLLILLFNAVKNRRDGSRIFIFSILILTVTAVNDILYSNQIINTAYMVPVGFILFIASQSLLLSRRFAGTLNRVEELTKNLKDFNSSLARFVPFQFFQYMNKNNITEVKLGDHVLKNMTILFADIRSFTTLSETMTPRENFRFLNSFLSQVVPVIRTHGGFVDKYMGDGIMALFPESPNNGIEAAISLQKAVQVYNRNRRKAGYVKIRLGIGLHTGNMIMGTIGEENRMETTVISDTVNAASRMEQLTKPYGASIIISENMHKSITGRQRYNFRFLGSTYVKGKKEPVTIYDVLDGLEEEELKNKLNTKENFEKAVRLFEYEKYTEASGIFLKILKEYPDDKAAELYYNKCRKETGGLSAAV